MFRKSESKHYLGWEMRGLSSIVYKFNQGESKEEALEGCAIKDLKGLV